LVTIEAGIVGTSRADEGGSGHARSCAKGGPCKPVVIAGNGGAYGRTAKGTDSGVLAFGLAGGKGKGQDGKGEKKAFHGILMHVLKASGV
jgi:hypothetical protein